MVAFRIFVNRLHAPLDVYAMIAHTDIGKPRSRLTVAFRTQGAFITGSHEPSGRASSVDNLNGEY